MKPLITLLAVFSALAVALVVVYQAKRHDETPEVEASLAPVTESYRRPVSDDPLHPAPDPEVLARLDHLIERMDALESKVAAAETTPRRSLKQEPLPPSRFDDQDLDTLRALVRTELSERGRLVAREEIEAEAWRERQEELAATARLLGKRLDLPVDRMDPLVATLCADGRWFFDLERGLADENHDLDATARLGREFRSARVRLSRDLARLFTDEVVVARIFLYVVTKGDEDSLTVDADQALELQRAWLR